MQLNFSHAYCIIFSWLFYYSEILNALLIWAIKNMKFINAKMKNASFTSWKVPIKKKNVSIIKSFLPHKNKIPFLSLELQAFTAKPATISDAKYRKENYNYEQSMLDKSIPSPLFFSFNIHVRHSKEQLQDFWQITIIKQSLIEQNAIFALSWKQAKYLFCFLRAFGALSEPTIIYVFFFKVFSHFFLLSEIFIDQ